MAPHQVEAMVRLLVHPLAEEDMAHQPEGMVQHQRMVEDLRHQAVIVDHPQVPIPNCGIGSLLSTPTDPVRLLLKNLSVL